MDMMKEARYVGAVRIRRNFDRYGEDGPIALEACIPNDEPQMRVIQTLLF